MKIWTPKKCQPPIWISVKIRIWTPKLCLFSFLEANRDFPNRTLLGGAKVCHSHVGQSQPIGRTLKRDETHRFWQGVSEDFGVQFQSIFEVYTMLEAPVTLWSRILWSLMSNTPFILSWSLLSGGASSSSHHVDVWRSWPKANCSNRTWEKALFYCGFLPKKSHRVTGKTPQSGLDVGL